MSGECEGCGATCGECYCVETGEPAVWEYLTSDWIDHADVEEAFDRLGEKGWELVAVEMERGQCVGFFKRLKRRDQENSDER